MSERVPRDVWVLLIGIGKVLKSAALSGVAIAALLLVHHDVAETLRHWVFVLGIAPGGHVVREALAEAGVLDDHRLRLISVLMFVYSALFAVEGAGLLLRRRWGEWVTIAITGSFIPIEVYETVHQPHVGRVVVTLVNVVAVAYLAHRIRARRRAERELSPARA